MIRPLSKKHTGFGEFSFVCFFNHVPYNWSRFYLSKLLLRSFSNFFVVDYFCIKLFLGVHCKYWFTVPFLLTFPITPFCESIFYFVFTLEHTVFLHFQFNLYCTVFTAEHNTVECGQQITGLSGNTRLLCITHCTVKLDP